MILVTAPVKYDLAESSLFCTLRDHLTDDFRGFRFRLALYLLGDLFVEGRGGYKGVTLLIINDLCIDVGQTAENVETWAFRCPHHTTSYSLVASITSLTFLFKLLRHLRPHLPVLPALRRITSSA